MGIDWERSIREHFVVMQVLCILNMVMVTWVCTYVKMDQIQHLKCSASNCRDLSLMN